jgi:hypothetical protein
LFHFFEKLKIFTKSNGVSRAINIILNSIESQAMAKTLAIDHNIIYNGIDIFIYLRYI